MRARAALLIWAGLAIFCAVAFQNCSFKIPGLGSHFDSSTQYSGGGGVDGKTYAHILSVGLCPDGSFIDSKIVVKADMSALLTRSNCTDLNPPKSVVVTFDPLNSSYLFYDGNRYANGLENLTAIDRDSAGNLYLSGSMRPVDKDLNVAIVAKLDPTGTLVWAKKVGMGWEQSVFTALHVTDLDTVVVAGIAYQTGVFGRTAVLMELSPTGEILKTYFYTGIQTAAGSKSAYVKDFAIIGSSAFIVGGFFHADGDNLDRYVAKINLDNGQIVWQKGDTILSPSLDANKSGNIDPGLHKVVTNANGEVFITGQLLSFTGTDFSPTATLTKLNADGSMGWSIVQGRQPGPLALAGNGDVLFGGAEIINSRPTSFFSRLMAAGDQVAASKVLLSPSEGGGWLTSIRELIDQSYLISGVEADSTGHSRGSLRSVNRDGSIDWSMRYHRTVNDGFTAASALTPLGVIWAPVVTTATDNSGQYTSLLLRLNYSKSEFPTCQECSTQTDDMSADSPVLPTSVTIPMIDPLPPGMPGFNGIFGPILDTLPMVDLQIPAEIH